MGWDQTVLKVPPSSMKAMCFLSAVFRGKGQVSGRSMPLRFRYGQCAMPTAWGDL